MLLGLRVGKERRMRSEWSLEKKIQCNRPHILHCCQLIFARRIYKIASFCIHTLSQSGCNFSTVIPKNCVPVPPYFCFYTCSPHKLTAPIYLKEFHGVWVFHTNLNFSSMFILFENCLII